METTTRSPFAVTVRNGGNGFWRRRLAYALFTAPTERKKRKKGRSTRDTENVKELDRVALEVSIPESDSSDLHRNGMKELR